MINWWVDHAVWLRLKGALCSLLGHRWVEQEWREIPDYPWIVDYSRECERCERWESVPPTS